MGLAGRQKIERRRQPLREDLLDVPPGLNLLPQLGAAGQ
jgi:hypothetical protein